MSRATIAGCCLIAVTMTGCPSGPKMVDAKGRIISGGQPINVGQKGVLQVMLVPQATEGTIDQTNYAADVDKEQGSFSVNGGVPQGKYKIVVLWLDPYPLTDKLNGKFGFDNSPLVREVTGEPLEIDIAAP